MRRIIAFLIVIFVVSCKSYNSQITILPLSPFVFQDSSFNNFTKQNDKSKVLYFLLEKYDPTNPNNISRIDSFAMNQFTNYDKSFSFFTIYFYKSSAITSKKYKENSSDRIDSHVDDLAYQYIWIGGKFRRRLDFNNGKLVNGDSTVIIEDKIAK